jgi:hypothetical protein
MTLSDYKSHFDQLVKVAPCEGRALWASQFAAQIRSSLWVTGVRIESQTLAAQFQEIADEFIYRDQD